jgi:hypothetical protein
MPLFDVHLRMPVRFKFRDVEAENAEAACRKAADDPDLMHKAEMTVQREWDSGPIAHVEMDESAPLSAIVDLVGDGEYEHTVDFDYDASGNPVPMRRESQGSTCVVEAIAHAAASTRPPASDAQRAADPIATLIQGALGGISSDEAPGALAALDEAVARIAAARSAVSSHLESVR